MSSVHDLRKQVSQLEQQASMSRISVSKACKELMDYCMTHQQNDVLVTGISTSDNPLRESKTCALL